MRRELKSPEEYLVGKIAVGPFLLFDKVKNIKLRILLFPFVGAVGLATFAIMAIPVLLTIIWELSLAIIYDYD